jgi:hypothetical protein
MDSSPGNHGNIASLSVVGWHAPKWLLMTWIVCCSQGSEIRASTMWVQQKCKWTQLIILYVLYYVTSFHKLCEFFEIFCVFARHYYSMADQQNSSKMLTTHFPWHCWASKVLFSWALSFWCLCHLSCLTFLGRIARAPGREWRICGGCSSSNIVRMALSKN